ncbi:MAG TPA: DciA family protein [Candidatus Wallbacteria bacterium]|nr:DciA family protein [Candidatus Wallbacteria bacterium]
MLPPDFRPEDPISEAAHDGANRRRKTAGGFEPIDAIAQRYVNQLPAAGQYRDINEIKKMWPDISGDFICSNTAVTSLKDGNLIITAASTPFLFHLRSAKKNYINTINQRLGYNAVKEIFYKIGVIRRETDNKPSMFDEVRDYAKKNEVMFYSIENVEIPDDVQASINDFVASLNIKDSDLCEKIEGAAKVIYKVTQYKKRNGYAECAMCSSLYDKTIVSDTQEASGDNGVCEYCRFKLSRSLGAAVKRITANPWENYEAHTLKCPDTGFREFEYIRKREFMRVKEEVDGLVKKFIMSESAEVFKELDYKIRLALCLYETQNYFEIKEFGAGRLEIMAAALGPNARAVYARGALAVKF